MAKYIDADAFLEHEIKRCDGEMPFIGTCATNNFTLKSEIDKFQTIDAEPVVHGHWLVTGRRTAQGREVKCSVCGVSFMISPMALEWIKDTKKFCCRCGSRMYGRADNGT